MKWISIKKKLSYSEVKGIADKLNIKLPEDYCQEIGNINGGVLDEGVYFHPKLGGIPYSRNVNLCQNAKANAIELFNVLDEGSKKYFPFGSVGNGDYFCFDLKSQKVVLYSHESERVYAICDTFTELINEILSSIEK